MRFFKIIAVIFLIYFIRRFIEMYKVMKRIQEEQIKAKAAQGQGYSRPRQDQGSGVIDAEYKVLRDS